MSGGPRPPEEPDPLAAGVYARAGMDQALLPGSRPALVVVDLVLGFTDPASPLACEADGAVAATAMLVREFRSQDWPVYFTTVTYDEVGAIRAATFLEKVPQLRAMQPGSSWVGIDPRLGPVPDREIIPKWFASGFFATPLASRLAASGCDTIVVTGASTSGCVRATVVDALQHGYRVVVPCEAVADRLPSAHWASLADIASRYGEVWSLEQTREWLAGIGPARTGGGGGDT